MVSERNKKEMEEEREKTHLSAAFSSNCSIQY